MYISNHLILFSWLLKSLFFKIYKLLDIKYCVGVYKYDASLTVLFVIKELLSGLLVEILFYLLNLLELYSNKRRVNRGENIA